MALHAVGTQRLHIDDLQACRKEGGYAFPRDRTRVRAPTIIAVGHLIIATQVEAARQTQVQVAAGTMRPTAVKRMLSLMG